MCGIIGASKVITSRKRFEKALESISHRGPDNQTIYEDSELFLGHARLSIIDLSERANQPFFYKDYVLVYNGEIYNYKEIRSMLEKEGYIFETNSDTEVLIKAYAHFKERCLKLFNGMFAFCVYNKKTKEFFLARDRFGKKPLYYTFIGNNFIFSSEIKAILKLLDKKPAINNLALSSYLSFWAPIKDLTFYEGIKKLMPSYFMRVKNNRCIIKKYYDPIRDLKFEKDESLLLKRIEKELFKAVERRLVSDVEVASLLSGGLDSSFVSFIYAKVYNKKINTFSIGYKDYKVYDELYWANLVANHINSNHHSIEISRADFLENIDKVIYYLDEPISDPATLPTYILTKHIKENGIKVALSGEGSDELFFGYDKYFRVLKFYDISKALTKESKIFLSELLKEVFNQNLLISRDFEYLKRALYGESIFKTVNEGFSDFQKSKLLSIDFESSEELMAYLKSKKIKEPSLWIYYIDTYVWISEVLMMKVDKMSMANSVEIRAPFLDKDLINTVLKTDPPLRIGNENKILLKKIASKYLPKDVVYRKKKGFSSPFLEWLLEDKKENLLLDWLRANKEHGLFKKEFLEFLFKSLQDDRYKREFKLMVWSLELFTRWFKNVYML